MLKIMTFTLISLCIIIFVGGLILRTMTVFIPTTIEEQQSIEKNIEAPLINDKNIDLDIFIGNTYYNDSFIYINAAEKNHTDCVTLENHYKYPELPICFCTC